MRIRLLLPMPGKRDGEWYYAVVGTGVLLLGLVAARLPLPWFPRCHFHAWTGVPCMTCGAGRCLRLLASGEMGAAWHMQPFITALTIGAFLGLIYAGLAVLLRQPRIRVEGWTHRHWVRLAIALVLAALVNWAYLIAAHI